MTIDPLMRSQLADLFRLNSDIGPVKVPVRRHVLVQLEVKLEGCALNHVVSHCCRAQYQLLAV